MSRHERAVERLGEVITERPGAVVLAFLAVTLLFAGGLGETGTEAGTGQFTEDVPAQQAFEDVQDRFGPRGESADTASTQLIQRGENVLAREELIRMLALQESVLDREELRATEANSAAAIVARTIDPEADTTADQRATLEAASDREVREAVRANADNPAFTGQLSEDFNTESATASATIGTVTHELPGGVSETTGNDANSPMTPIQQEIETIAERSDGQFQVFGSGIVSAEFQTIIEDSLLIVVPAAVVLLLFFLIVAYRDPIDLAIGLLALSMTVVWTFGFMGLAGIPFSQMLISVPVLLLAVGIDFGIHIINRYREERSATASVTAAMERTTDQLLVAFVLVIGTTVVGFGANYTSSLPPIRNFGLVSALGIAFTFLIFGIFMPALKVLTDRWREDTLIPEFSSEPLGEEDSALGRVLPVGVVIARRAPIAFLLVTLVAAGAMGAYGSEVDTSFSDEDFLPPEEQPGYIEYLPAELQPAEPQVTGTMNYLEETFPQGQEGTVVVSLEGQLREDYALESIHRAGEDPPETVIRDGRYADSQSIITVIEQYAAQNPEFAALVERNDRNGNGVPDQNLELIYDELYASPYEDQARQYITEDYRAAQVQYAVEGDAAQEAVGEDARELADRHRLDATATGETLVFEAVSDVIFESALRSLVLALAATGVFLVAGYWVVARRPSLGVVNLFPIAVAIAALAGTMRYAGIPFNALTATILSVSIGLGVDYTVHVVHRFVDELDAGADTLAALDRTVRGTGGALTGSMLTTVAGMGVLVLAITPILGQFGLLLSISILYAYLASLLVLPSALVVWARVA
ncbi:bifunctional preprotein translocase subunit SecD/SecF [Halalkalicoccus paucihalophilus]|uniref:Bifunctional preprotein translocase subunit SecD/SecF n=1 Tax=Halalkalicoccus paucihalophilus TaxID=1008153 RepID=A0A151AGU1_9EURY|nr:MMPL family transporter [Halalkalicoccus paucihalophilus]KYH26843.1 bifunctional preprotein translocase subunit SecD/SecF [Halalkalicoccus paucihalophilus]